MVKKSKSKAIDLEKSFRDLRDPIEGYKKIQEMVERSDDSGIFLERLKRISRINGKSYPSQGLLTTPYDALNSTGMKRLSKDMIRRTVLVRRYFLELFNHPYRAKYLYKVDDTKFIPLHKISCKAIETAVTNGTSLSVGDFGASVTGSINKHISRTERYAEGPFLKIGRHARSIFVGSASPDVWNSSLSISTMAMSNCLCCIPRNGILSDMKRQSDIAKEIFEILKEYKEIILDDREDSSRMYELWKSNVIGVLESNPQMALKRCELLYKEGLRTFRIYTPEPGSDCIDTMKEIKKNFNDIEIFVGQIVDLEHAKSAQDNGADGIYIGIGGGGRCTTGVRSGTAVDWPELIWNLRGELDIPIIVEGGASDHVAVSLLLGVSGIGVSRVIAGGTIESPGGYLYYKDKDGSLFKPYGGEASARTKYLDNKLLPFNIPSFVEGEITRAYINHIPHSYPTLTFNLHTLMEDSVLSLVFRGVQNIQQLQAMDPSPLKMITAFGEFQRNTH